MMHYQYHCACCDKVVESSEKVCQNCGSQNIRTPYGFWIFCIVACFIVSIVFKVGQVYLYDHQNVPVQQGFLTSLEQGNQKSNQ